MDPSKIRETLMIDEKRIQEDMLQRAKAHLGLDSKGRTHVHDPAAYAQKEVVLLHLIGIHYAHAAKLRDKDSIMNSELAEVTGVSAGPLTARLTELRKEGKIETVGRGENRIVVSKIPRILGEIESGGPKAKSGGRTE